MHHQRRCCVRRSLPRTHRLRHAANALSSSPPSHKPKVKQRDAHRRGAQSGRCMPFATPGSMCSGLGPQDHLRQSGNRGQNVGGHHVARNNVKHAVLLQAHRPTLVSTQDYKIQPRQVPALRYSHAADDCIPAMPQQLQRLNCIHPAALNQRITQTATGNVTLWHVNVAMLVAKPRAIAVGPALLPKYLSTSAV